jgi:excisionase family DNA binding protein
MHMTATDAGEELDELRLFTVPQVAELLQVAERSVWSWVGDGSLPSVVVGHRCRRITPEAVREFVGRSQAGSAL